MGTKTASTGMAAIKNLEVPGLKMTPPTEEPVSLNGKKN